MRQALALNLLKSWQHVFLTWQAWAGKTYVINQYIQRLWSCNIPVAITASTWIAATHIWWTTIHSRSGIGIKDHLSHQDLELLQQKEYLHKQINASKVLIIDEISMISAQTLDNIDRVVQMMRRDGRPFGWMQVVLVGDFFQLPPVIRHTLRESQRFAFGSKAWKALDPAICYLTSQHRQSDDKFWTLLNELRVGELSQASLSLLKQRIDETIDLSDAMQLYTHNMDVDTINALELEKIDAELYTYQAHWYGDSKLYRTLMKSLLAPELLRLKLWARVIFVKNNPQMWYVNWTTGVVVGIQDLTKHPIVQLSDGREIIVEPETRSIENASEILASVKQYPLKLARAITIHKSQGMTLDRAIIDLSKVFEAWQWYVALSRLRDLEGLKLLGIHEHWLRAHSLVLRADAYFQKESSILEENYKDRNTEIFENLHKSFVEMLGWSYTPDTIERSKTTRGTTPKRKVWDTYRQTLELIEHWHSLEEIATQRKLALSTIEWHLFKITQLFPEADISAFKPEQTTLDRVKAAIELCKNQGKVDDKWYVRLSSIYQALKGSLEYKLIKRCMLFL